MKTTAYRWLLVPVFFALTLACNPAALDDAVKEAPVRSIRPPSGFGSPDIGRIVLPLDAPGDGKTFARLLVAGSQPSGGAAVIDFAADGTTKSHKDDGSFIAGAPFKSAALLADGGILLGQPTYGAQNDMTGGAPGRGSLVKATVDATGTLSFERGYVPVEPKGIGLAVAVGAIAGGQAQDYVALSNNELLLFLDAQHRQPAAPSFGCEIALETSVPESYHFRALAVGDIDPTKPGDEIVVGVPRDSGPGHVAVFSRGTTDGSLECEKIAAPAAAANVRFGASLVIADVDGDGKRDLVVGAPPDKVAVYAGTDFGLANVPTVFGAPDAGSGEFGFRVAAFDLKDDGLPEIVVSATDLTIDGMAGAGKVFVFQRSGATWTSSFSVADHNPTAQARYGFSLGQLLFKAGCPGKVDRKLLVVGAIEEVFTYFRLSRASDDPRCFGGAKM